MRMTHQINKSSPDICIVPHLAPGTGDTGEGDTPLPSSISWSGCGGITELGSNRTECGAQGFRAWQRKLSAESPAPPG